MDAEMESSSSRSRGTASNPTGGTRLGVSADNRLSETQTSSRLLTQDIGFGRRQVKDLGERFGALHDRSFFAEWRTRTAERGRSSSAEMLDVLADLGLAWRDIARLVGVSVPAVKKWRRGDGVTGENRRKIASLLALCDLIEDHYMVSDIGSWFEMPIVADVNFAPLDLYENNRADLVFRFASGHDDPERIMTDYRSDWRTSMVSEFETFRSADGSLSIRPKGGDNDS